MGTGTRPKPLDSVTATNVALGLSQKWVSQLSDLQDDIPFHEISSSEQSTHEPALPILLKYTEAAGICVDVLIDDELDLPKKLPGNPKHRGVNLAASSGSEGIEGTCANDWRFLERSVGSRFQIPDTQL
jgi:hypothetical protein